MFFFFCCIFFFQAEDGIRDAQESRGLGDVYKRQGKYSEDPNVWVRGMERLVKKIDHSRQVLPKPILMTRKDAKIGIISAGSTDPAIVEACDRLEEKGLPVDYMRLRALPVGTEVHDFIRSYDRVYIVEMNRDGQLHQILSLEAPDRANQLKKVALMDGLPLTAEWIYEQINAQEVK